MIEEIIRKIAEITGLDTSLRTGAEGGISLYPSSSSVEAFFLDGGSLCSLTIKAKFKGTDPVMLFSEAENACRAADSFEGENFVLRTESYPFMESSNENGMHIITCSFHAKYISESDSDGISLVFVNSDGKSLDFSSGRIRCVSVGGLFAGRSVIVDENCLFDGGEVISERCGVRRITLNAALCGGFAAAEEALSGIFSGDSGRLYFYRHDSACSIGCVIEEIDSDAENGVVFAKLTLLCPYPFFEVTESRCFQICGTDDLWEFDDWEMTEEELTELSSVISESSVFVENDGNYETGCLINVRVLRTVSEIKVVNVGTKEFIGVTGTFSAGDIIEFCTKDGEKSITLLSSYDSSKSEDITSRIKWGSSFFKIAAGGTRLYVVSDSETEGLSAYVTFTERSDGI